MDCNRNNVIWIALDCIGFHLYYEEKKSLFQEISIEPLLRVGVEETVSKKTSLNFVHHHFYQYPLPGKREVPCQQYSYTPLLGPLAARGSQAMMMKSMRVSHLPRVFFLSRGFLTHHLQLECCGSAGPLDWVLSVHNGYTLNTKVAPPNSYHDLAHSCTRFPCYLGMEI